MPKPLPTLERVRQLLHYDASTGVFTWKVRRNQHAPAGGVAGTVSPNGYRHIVIDGKHVLAHRLAWFVTRGEWPPEDIDHRTNLRDDNRATDLRPLDRSGNMQNLKRAHRDNKTGLLGVVPCRHRFAAHIRADGRNRYLGTYDTPEQAHEAYLHAKRQLHPAGTL